MRYGVILLRNAIFIFIYGKLSNSGRPRHVGHRPHFTSGKHYDETWASHDVSQMEYTDKEGKRHKGAYWTVEQVEEATKGLQFPSAVTKWDRFVAFNGFKADLCKVLTDELILGAAYEFFFMDEDWDLEKPGSSPCKVWEYFACKYEH